MAVDLKQYKKARDKGLVRLARMSKNSVTLYVDQFDATGEPADAAEERLSLRELVAQRDAVKEHLDNLNAFIADLEALPEVQPVGKG